MEHQSNQVNGEAKLSNDHTNKIVQALQLVYSGRTSNEERQAATDYLEKAKSERAAPGFGFQLSRDRNQPAVVRHYGLLCIENHIKYHWDTFQQDYDSGSNMLVSLASQLQSDEPLFLRNKVAHLWTITAERGWPQSWQNFDQDLNQLWSSGSVAKQEVVLHVLETLSDEVFSKDDSTAGIRGVELGKYCVGIFTSAAVLESVFGPRKAGSEVRYGVDGWFLRLLEPLRHILQQETNTQESSLGVALKTLSVIRSVMPWMVFKSVSDSDCVELLCRCLMTSHPSMQMAGVEALHALFHRQRSDEDKIELAVAPLLTAEGVSLLRNFYQTLTITVDDIDDTKYRTAKRFSEVICAIGMYLVNDKSLIANPATDLDSFFNFLVSILRNPSLVVSVPVVYLWTKLLSSELLSRSPIISQLIGILLELCSNRLIRYEVLPDNAADETLQFLNEDFETLPEKHAFLGNYRRFCSSAIEHIVHRAPSDAMSYILSQSDDLIRHFYQEDQQNFNEASFSTDTLASLQIDAQCSVISTALKSFIQTLVNEDLQNSEVKGAWKPMELRLKEWCINTLELKFRNPVIRKRLLIMVTEIALSALTQDSQIAIQICKTVLSSITSRIPDSSTYDDALKDLQFVSPRELQKLATSFADQLLPHYDDLDVEVKRLAHEEIIDTKVTMDYRAFLFTIILHSSSISDGSRGDRLLSMINPILESWNGSTVEKAIDGFPSFCAVLGLDEFPQAFMSRNAHQIEDWATVQLDGPGNALKEKIKSSTDLLPLLSTKSLLSISTERLPKESPVYQFSKNQWKQAMPTILTRMLPLIKNAHAFSNPETWSSYPPQMRLIITRIIQDRVWQNGISNESRDDFYARVRQSKGTLEGLASTIRACLRSVRELSMFILHYFSSFDDDFYGIQELPQPLSVALYADAYHLSSHQANALLKLSSTIIFRCPPKHRKHFLPPILVSMFKQFDAKISAEWDAIEQRKASNASSEDDLDSEMKAESVLRNVTNSTVLEVSHLLGGTAKAPIKTGEVTQPSHRAVILQSTAILEPIILFCTHAIRVRDSRTCSLITHCLRSILPEFVELPSERNLPNGAQYTQSRRTSLDPTAGAQIREYFASDVLKASITSLNDPYFSEASLQRDIASFIAGILNLYAPSTTTVKQVLLSLPSITEAKVDMTLQGIWQAKTEREQRAWVLRLLEGVRGISIHESGKIQGRSPRPKTQEMPSGTLRDQYMVVDGNVQSTAVPLRREQSPDLEGVADLFG